MNTILILCIIILLTILLILIPISIALYIQVRIGMDIILIPKKNTTFNDIDKILSDHFGHAIAQHRLNKSVSTLDTLLFGLCQDNKLPFDFDYISDLIISEVNRVAFTPEFNQMYDDMIEHINKSNDGDNFDDIWARR